MCPPAMPKYQIHVRHAPATTSARRATVKAIKGSQLQGATLTGLTEAEDETFPRLGTSSPGLGGQAAASMSRWAVVDMSSREQVYAVSMRL